MVNYREHLTALCVTGVSRTRATKAIKWLKGRSIPAFYRPADNSLCAFEIKGGREHTYQTLHGALDAVRS